MSERQLKSLKGQAVVL